MAENTKTLTPHPVRKLSDIMVEDQLHYLSSTDVDEAELESNYVDKTKEEKSFISQLKINDFHNYKSDSERTTHALASDKYNKEFRPELKKAHVKYKTIKNQRNTAERIISVWQTMVKRGAL